MSDMPRLGDVINKRFEVMELLGTGRLSSVYKVSDLSTGCIYVLKVYKKEAVEGIFEYTKHLSKLQNVFQDSPPPNLLLPIEIGETEAFVYQISRYILSPYKNLQDYIKNNAPLGPDLALTVVAKVANALDALHKRNVIHGDVKPSNIIGNPEEGEIYLIDFGMVRLVEPSKSIFLVGTYQYMHPSLKSKILSEVLTPEKAKLSAYVGHYIDIYSLGIVTLQMITGETLVPTPLTKERLEQHLKDKNSVLNEAQTHNVKQLVDLVFDMLTIDLYTSDTDAATIYKITSELIGSFQEAKPITKPATDFYKIEIKPPKGNDIAQGIREALEKLENVAKSLEQSTAAMIRTVEDLKVPPQPTSKTSTGMFEEMDMAFKNATSRIKTSWNIGILMTVFSFFLIVSMVACAVTLSIITGKSWWGIIFGGVSATMLIGTLLWRPYDRVFRATILAQQLEIIHVQSIVTFKNTDNVERRIETCREAIDKLQALLEKHAIPEPPRKKS